MIDVYYGGFPPDCQWPQDEARMRVRAIDVARAAALTVSAGAGRSLFRRVAHITAVALEALAHLRNDASGNGLHTVDLDRLDATARSEVSHRLGVGLARLIAERSSLGLVDFYNLDALASDPNAPVKVVRRNSRSRRRPDFVGRDVSGAWSLVEAKARAAPGRLGRARADAIAQVRAVELRHFDGSPLATSNRVACVTRLGSRPIAVFADDPPPDSVDRVISLDPALLTWTYYALARDILARTPRPGPGISGAETFAGIGLLGGDLVLGIHRALIPVLDSPDELIARRAELQDEFLGMQADAEEAEDVSLSVGRDGFALASRGLALESVLYGTE